MNSSVVKVMARLSRARAVVKYVVVIVEPLTITRGMPSQSVYVSYTVMFVVQDHVSKTRDKPASKAIAYSSADR